MSSAFYSEVYSFESFDKLISQQRDNPTRRLNILLRNGVSKKQLTDFLKEGPIKMFSIDGEGWSGIKRHIRYCESFGWGFSVDIEYFINSEDPNQIIKISRFK